MTEAYAKTEILVGSVAGMLVTRLKPSLEVVLWLALGEREDDEPAWKWVRFRRDLARMAAKSFCLADRILVRGFYPHGEDVRASLFSPVMYGTYAQKVPRCADYADVVPG